MTSPPTRGGPPLPRGWREVFDEEHTGQWFYVNESSGRSTWKRPDATERPQGTQPLTAAATAAANATASTMNVSALHRKGMPIGRTSLAGALALGGKTKSKNDSSFLSRVRALASTETALLSSSSSSFSSSFSSYTAAEARRATPAFRGIRGPTTVAEKPKAYEVTGLQVLDPKTTHRAEVPAVGPYYPVRAAGDPALAEHFRAVEPESEQAASHYLDDEQGALYDNGGSGEVDDKHRGALPYHLRTQFGVPTVPARVNADDGSYELRPPKGRGSAGDLPPANSLRHRARWVNVPPPLPLVPVFRPAIDDRYFWEGLCDRSAHRVQRYHNFWVACLDGDLDAVRRLVNAEGVEAAAQVPLGWSVRARNLRRGSSGLHFAVR